MIEPSPYFTWRELTRSETAARFHLSNEPDADARACLVALCKNILEPLRAKFGPIRVTSAYRSPAVNAKVGSSPDSQHTKGQAADIEAPAVSNLELARYIRDHLDFDQVILEFYNDADPHSGWVHVSWSRGRNRRQTRVARSINGKTVYSTGLPK